MRAMALKPSPRHQSTSGGIWKELSVAYRQKASDAQSHTQPHEPLKAKVERAVRLPQCSSFKYFTSAMACCKGNFSKVCRVKTSPVVLLLFLPSKFQWRCDLISVNKPQLLVLVMLRLLWYLCLYERSYVAKQHQQESFLVCLRTRISYTWHIFRQRIVCGWD